MFKPTKPAINFPELEHEILSYWEKNGIVKKYLLKNASSKERFSFLDGPITANNPMGVHHAWGRTYKDLWQRFFTMKGKKQRYQNGFDCQGLWVEVEVEKELGFKTKKDIEKYGVADFVQKCKERVLKYAAIQTQQSKRLGYFMDWDHSYFTMSDENNYMIWHFLKKCHEKGWMYKGKDSVPWCPRCETAISQHEMLTEDYKELMHETVFFKLQVTNRDFALLAWTTTPWTIPANVALAVNPNFIYQEWQNRKTGEKIIILREDQLPQRENNEEYLSDKKFIDEIVNKDEWEKEKDYKGSELVGLHYNGPFDNLPRVKEAQKENPKTFHTIVAGEDLVVATKGTGILHVAPGAGQEDFRLSKKENLPVISVILDNADYLPGMLEFSGKNAKKHPEIIIDYLKSHEQGKYLQKTLKFIHRYPACWRCKTELVWKVTDEWYLAMDVPSKKDGKTFREKMQKVAKNISWHPEFGLERELDWLKNMSDWLISKKNRYWGLALPIYECKKCNIFEVIGGREELKTRAVFGWEKFEGKSPHKPWIDQVKIKCTKCGERISRIEDVGNPWLDAGIVSFSTIAENNQGEPLYEKNRTKWQEWFPADFITESFPGQFKNWFYALIAMSAALEDEAPFKTVLGFATLFAEDGRPMHKSWGNMIEFNQGAEKIGVDVMRWMFAKQNPSNNLLFGYRIADEVRRKFHLILWNTYNFFVTYANLHKFKPNRKKADLKNILDRWIISKLNNLILNVESSLEKYDAYMASIKIEEFVNDLSTWFIRRSRGRVNQEACLSTLYEVLITLAKILAPLIPFVSDEIFTNLSNEESVHLSTWPKINKELIDLNLEKEMSEVRSMVEVFHSLRKEKNIKLRIPVIKATYNRSSQFSPELEQVMSQELNIKQLKFNKMNIKKDTLWTVNFSDNNLLPEEGAAREIVRKVQQLRKEQEYGLADKIILTLPSWPKKYEEFIKDKTLSEKIVVGSSIKISKIS